MSKHFERMIFVWDNMETCNMLQVEIYKTYKLNCKVEHIDNPSI
jgi:hypothetical protein